MTIYATIKEGRIIVDEDFKKFLPKMTGRVVITTANRGKEAMYAYYHAVVLEVCMAFLREMGEPADESYADDFLKFMFAKRNVHNPLTGEETAVLMTKREMSYGRLTTFVGDCVLYLEQMGYEVPTSDEYKNQLK
jgi:hypothetical protein